MIISLTKVDVRQRPPALRSLNWSWHTHTHAHAHTHTITHPSGTALPGCLRPYTLCRGGPWGLFWYADSCPGFILCKYKNRGFDSLIQKNCGPWFIVLYAIVEIEFIFWYAAVGLVHRLIYNWAMVYLLICRCRPWFIFWYAAVGLVHSLIYKRGHGLSSDLQLWTLFLSSDMQLWTLVYHRLICNCGP